MSNPYDSRRPYYQAELANGVGRFFEPRRDTCPWCGSLDLSIRLQTTDLIQRKPGRFTLEQCGACQHIFQNPRLTRAGLDFYYRDFMTASARRWWSRPLKQAVAPIADGLIWLSGLPHPRHG
jgi:hypothetical protein